jgi:predicted RecA/RadA family phage recombinase
MKNYIQPGNVVTLTSVFGITSGQGVLLNKFFGVANYDCPIPGNPIEVSVVGVYSLPKAATIVFAVGDYVYWDDTAHNVTSVATAHTLIGAATAAAASGDATAAVRLNGVAVF